MLVEVKILCKLFKFSKEDFGMISLFDFDIIHKITFADHAYWSDISLLISGTRLYTNEAKFEY